MILNADGSKPIYVQIAEWLENEILTGNIRSNDKVYSQYQLADMFNINPATAGKGLNILADEAILFKKRGLGMFVSNDAKKIILSRRKEQTLKKLIEELVLEAKRLNIKEEDLISLIKQANKGEEGS